MSLFREIFDLTRSMIHNRNGEDWSRLLRNTCFTTRKFWLIGRMIFIEHWWFLRMIEGSTKRMTQKHRKSREKTVKNVRLSRIPLSNRMGMRDTCPLQFEVQSFLIFNFCLHSFGKFAFIFIMFLNEESLMENVARKRKTRFTSSFFRFS